MSAWKACNGEHKLGADEVKSALLEATEKPVILYCSFCGKSQHEVTKLIAGPTAFICNECVDLCNDIIADDAKKAAAEEQAALVRKLVQEELTVREAKPRRWFQFWRTPEPTTARAGA